MSAAEERQFRGAHGETIVYDLYRPAAGEPRAWLSSHTDG